MTHNLDMDAARELAEAAREAAKGCKSFDEVCEIGYEEVRKMPEYWRKWIAAIEKTSSSLGLCPQCKRRILEEEIVKMAKKGKGE